MPTMKVDILSDEIIGREGGFLAIRRLRCENLRPDGSRSAPYICDFLVRPKGIDAVVVAVYARRGDTVNVLLRDGLRIPLALGRPAGELPIADLKPYLFFREVVAGIIERHDHGEAGVRTRAAIEVEEEAGYRVDPADIVLLGGGSFPSPGAMAEKFWFACVEVDPTAASASLAGDGSPMEEGASTTWMPLADAIAACTRGDIEDAKTEIVLRRLADHLASPHAM
jgi:ADP-ribose pyrophosphatase